MRKLVILLAVAAVAVGVYALIVADRARRPNGARGAATTPAARDADAPPQIFKFNNGAEPETLDPALMTGVPEHTLAMALFEGLVTYHPRTLEPTPGVAESWTISDDGLTYTFRLRPFDSAQDGPSKVEGRPCVWSNGDPLTSADFVYSWRRVLDPATAAEYAYQLWSIRNARDFTTGKLKDFSKVGIAAPDPRTLVVTLEHPTAFFLGLLAFETFMPVHRGCVEAHGKRWPRVGNIVSNGPFVLAEWRPQQRIVMRKNPRYWDAANVRLDAVVAYPIVNNQTALLRYETGELHWLNSLPAPMIPTLMQRPDYHQTPYLGTYFFRFNCTRKPFDDPRVRKAFNLAFDKATLCRHVLQGQYEPATSFVPPMLPPYESPKGLGYDPDRAAKLLAEAGYPGGRGFPRVTLLYNTSKRHEEIAEVAQQMWKKALGVDVQLLNQEWKVYLKTVAKLDYDLARSAWIGDYMDPNTFLDMFVTNGGNNRTGWSHARYDELIAAAARTPDAVKRFAMFREAEDILVNRELPIMPVYFYSNLSLRRPSVRGFWGNPRDLHPFKAIYLAPPAEAGR